MHRFDAGSADAGADAVHLRPLEVWVLAGPVGGIVVAAKQDAVAAHLGSFVTGCTLAHGSIKRLAIRITGEL